jgi:hypothetical protein
MTDTTRRLAPKRIKQDVQSFHSLSTVTNYAPMRDEATKAGLQQRYRAMVESQRQETEAEVQLKAFRDQARQAEWEFHEAVLAMKQSVLGQFGPNSDEIQALGYKRKSLRKRNRRRDTQEVTANEDQ